MSEENYNRVLDIIDSIQSLTEELRTIARQEDVHMDRYNAYVFNLLDNACEKANPYDTDLQDFANEIPVSDHVEDEEDYDLAPEDAED